MTDALVDELVALLRLERLEDNLFRGESRDIGTHRVFGGQVLGQALSAAQQTVETERSAHSLHAYFLRAGDIAAPIVYNVERARDGGSFSVRRVVAIQHGQAIFNCSVSFQISDMRREWGGCAGNIAYNLRALGGDPVVMGTLGTDGGSYRERLRALGIAIDGVRVIDDAYTAQAFIITDHDDNQITAFHPGAMNRSHVVHVDDVADIGLGIVSPDGKQGMKQHAAEFAARRINLSLLLSRPTKNRLGDYCFVIDLDGHIADEVVADCLRVLRAKQADVKFLGSYPAAGEQAHEVRLEADATEREATAWIKGLRHRIGR